VDSGGRLGEDANPNRYRTEDRFISLDRFLILALLRPRALRGVPETYNVHRRKANLEIPVSKLYDMMYDAY